MKKIKTTRLKKLLALALAFIMMAAVLVACIPPEMPENIVRVAAANNVTTVIPGGTVQFNARINDFPISAGISFHISEESEDSASISATGLLTVRSDAAMGAEIEVWATHMNFEYVATTITVVSAPFTIHSSSFIENEYDDIYEIAVNQTALFTFNFGGNTQHVSNNPSLSIVEGYEFVNVNENALSLTFTGDNAIGEYISIRGRANETDSSNYIRFRVIAAPITHPTVDITLVSNDGIIYRVDTIHQGTSLTNPHPVPVRAGFIIGGYYRDPLHTIPFPENFTGVTANANTRIYIRWRELFSVTFMADDAEPHFVQTNIADGDSAVSPAVSPTRDNYVFGGWWTAPEGEDGHQWIFSSPITTNLTLYARFNERLSVTFIIGGDAPNQVVTIGYGGQPIIEGSRVVAIENPSRDDYRFIGWFNAPQGTDGVRPWIFTGDNADTVSATNNRIYAHWIREFNITFITGIPLVIGDRVIDDGSTTTMPSETLTREGHVFAGWVTGPDSTTLFEFSAPITSDTRIYARWIRLFVVSFETGVSDIIVPNAVVTIPDMTTEAQIAAAPSTPQRDNYAFDGWFTQNVGGVQWNFANAVVEDMTLYARWTRLFTASFVLHNGEADITIPNVRNGETVLEPTSVPTRTNYRFTGWFTEAAGGREWNFNTDTISTGQTNIHAQWIRQFNVSFVVGENVQNAPGARVVDTGSTAGTAPSPAPTRVGFEFDGWFTDATFMTEFVFTNPITANTQIHARWLEIFTVTFVIDGIAQNQTLQIAETRFITNIPSFTAPSANDALDGWFKEPAFETRWNMATDTIEGNLRLYARWVVDPVQFPHTVTFLVRGQDGTVNDFNYTSVGERFRDDAQLTPYAFSNASFHYNYDIVDFYTNEALTTPWNFATDRVTGDIELFARLVRVFRFTFNYQDSRDNRIVRIRLNEFATEPSPAPTRANHAFDGWFTTPETNGREWNFTTDAVEENTTIYARWTNLWTVTFNRNNSQEAYVRGNIRHNTTTTALSPAPTRDGHRFAGWYDAGLTTPWNPATPITSNLELFARWESRLTITFHHYSYSYEYEYEPGEFETRYGVVSSTANIYQGDAVTRPNINPTRDGFNFINWYADADFETLFDFSETLTTVTTIYARWVRSFTIQFDLNFDTPNRNTFTHNHEIGSLVTRPTTDPTRDGWEFDGWFRNYGGHLWNFSEYEIIEDMALDNVIRIFALWTELRTITFDPDNGETMLPREGIRNNTVTHAPIQPTRTGYVFGGWFAEGSNIAWNFATDYVTSNLTLTARWLRVFNVNFVFGDSREPNVVSSHYGATVSRPLDPTRNGFTFDEWRTTPDASGRAWNFETDTVYSETNIYARWLEHFTVTFDRNNSQAPVEIIGVQGRTILPLSPTPIRVVNVDGVYISYVFVGWFTIGDVLWDFATDVVTSDMKLVAHWEQADIHVTVSRLFIDINNNIGLGEQVYMDGAPVALHIERSIVYGNEFLSVDALGNFTPLGHGIAHVRLSAGGFDQEFPVHVIVPPSLITLPDWLEGRDNLHGGFAFGRSDDMNFDVNLSRPNFTSVATNINVSVTTNDIPSGTFNQTTREIEFAQNASGTTTVTVTSNSGSAVETTMTFEFELNDGVNVDGWDEFRHTFEARNIYGTNQYVTINLINNVILNSFTQIEHQFSRPRTGYAGFIYDNTTLISIGNRNINGNGFEICYRYLPHLRAGGNSSSWGSWGYIVGGLQGERRPLEHLMGFRCINNSSAIVNINDLDIRGNSGFYSSGHFASLPDDRNAIPVWVPAITPTQQNPNPTNTFATQGGQHGFAGSYVSVFEIGRRFAGTRPRIFNLTGSTVSGVNRVARVDSVYQLNFRHNRFYDNFSNHFRFIRSLVNFENNHFGVAGGFIFEYEVTGSGGDENLSPGRPQTFNFNGGNIFNNIHGPTPFLNAIHSSFASGLDQAINALTTNPTGRTTIRYNIEFGTGIFNFAFIQVADGVSPPTDHTVWNFGNYTWANMSTLVAAANQGNHNTTHKFLMMSRNVGLFGMGPRLTQFVMNAHFVA
ncbi:MAG: InlB B-repeat-containing protein [Firmicutes bacterium]|nr:InlB B-repeat-containing protein [Bacillota bacterium]